MTTTTTTSTTKTGAVPTAAALEARARRAGFRPGFPPHLDRLSRHVDASACRRMKCPGCRTRGMGCKPFHKPGGYRVLAVCTACGAAEEI